MLSSLTIDSSLIGYIITQLESLQTEYQRHKALILTEDDLQSHLFSRIHRLFSVNTLTMDRGITGCALHSEVKFYDENLKLTLVPDLMVVSPSDISILHSVQFSMTPSGPKHGRLPTRDFEFGGDVLIVQLKFCRKKKGITSKDIQRYQVDLNKIKRLQTIRSTRSNGQNILFGIVAVFNKTNNGKDLFEDFVRRNPEDEQTKIFYGSGLVDFFRANEHSFGR